MLFLQQIAPFYGLFVVIRKEVIFRSQKGEINIII